MTHNLSTFFLASLQKNMHPCYLIPFAVILFCIGSDKPHQDKCVPRIYQLI
nr:hypothetical protein Itr_chr02CG01720 [Ipomoea trifida]